MIRIQCNVCGEDTMNKEVHIEISVHQRLGYFSQHDGDKVDLDVCGKCVDTILEAISKVCTIPPVYTEEECEAVWE